MNKQKFVHYVMLTFTYSIGLATTGVLIFGLFSAVTNIITK